MSEVCRLTPAPGSRIAVIGGGVAGISAAYLASQKHTVTIFEAADYLGGHTSTVTIPNGPDAGLRVDTGFIVLNDQTYPTLHRFLKKLACPVRYTDMSFSYYSEEDNFMYGSRSIAHLVSQRSSLLRPLFYKMLLGIPKFWKQASAILDSPHTDQITLGDFLDQSRLPAHTINHYILPMAGAIWSAPADEMRSFSARTILNFFKNHGLLRVQNQPRWQTVVGASCSYVEKFQSVFNGTILLNSSVSSLSRSNESVRITLKNGGTYEFDYVVIALHADLVLPILNTPTDLEREIFSPWRYSKNKTVLHTDTSVLPPRKRCWAAWNYRRERNRTNQSTISITYNMNILQGLESDRVYCVTLNPERPIREDAVVKEFDYTHPIYSKESLQSQKRLFEMTGQQRTLYCGSYHGFGFHEDAVKSGVYAGQLLGGAL